ncbi:MAG: acyl-CoA reductase-like NAD-dependent aldehyde dehydrogenase [Candidatus Binatia bacterium]|jgi:acyl-CoA reductase-like NAD-dependent aldehyde dehydrogenase
MNKYTNFIGGEWIAAKSGDTFQNVNPADTRETVAEYAASSAEDAVAAIDAASAAFAQWSGMTPVARGRVLSKAAEILAPRKAELTELLTREEGKTLFESGLEVGRAIDIFRFFGGNSYTIGGQTFPHDMPNILMYTNRQPLGVVALVTPWNFPIAIPAWKLAPALVSGNTVVLKPASQAPALSLEIAKALDEAGLPKGVLNVVTGAGSTVGSELATNAAVKALSFTGSYGVGQKIYMQLAERMARPQMEMGGKNPTIVLADADLDLAAQLTAVAGFGLTGQACTATSRAIVEKSVVEEFTAKLVAKAKAIKVGNGAAEGVNMGPAVNKQEFEGNLEYIKIAQEEGATVVCGGNALTEGDLAHGYYMEPTVIGGVTPNMRIAQEEVFGPVVSVIAVEDFEEAIAVANQVEFGLSASLVTRDYKKAMLYTNRIEAGVVKVNQISTGLALNVPFGGVKHSSSDSFKEQGPGAIDFYTKIKTVYLDYSA